MKSITLILKRIRKHRVLSIGIKEAASEPRWRDVTRHTSPHNLSTKDPVLHLLLIFFYPGVQRIYQRLRRVDALHGLCWGIITAQRFLPPLKDGSTIIIITGFIEPRLLLLRCARLGTSQLAHKKRSKLLLPRFAGSKGNAKERGDDENNPFELHIAINWDLRSFCECDDVVLKCDCKLETQRRRLRRRNA